VITRLSALSLLLALLLPVVLPRTASAAAPAAGEAVEKSAADALFAAAGLEGQLDREVFDAAYSRVEASGIDAGTIAIADMSQPSTAQRLYVIDLHTAKLLLRTWVAHGQNSGGLMAERFSNRPRSHQTSLGLYRVGEQIRSPKHGAALLLQGLDEGVNDTAEAREVIMHGADYVSAEFIATRGRLGTSWGCPAVPRTAMKQMIDALAGDGLLFVYGA
jgi:hypothetical protein